MAVAALIDSIDGTLARRVEIQKVLPWFDGAKLDDIVDYFTYVIVPVVFLYQLRLLPPSGTRFFAEGVIALLRTFKLTRQECHASIGAANSDEAVLESSYIEHGV